MTYIQDRGTALSRYRAPRRRQRARAMGGIFEFIDEVVQGATGIDVGGARAAACAPDADASVANLSAQINDVERTWNPTGFFSPDQIRTIVLQTNDYGNVAVNQMISAVSGIDSFEDKTASKQAFDDARGSFFQTMQKGLLFLAAANKAEDEGKAVDAPGLKFWVLDAMKESRKLTRAAAFIACNVSLLERFVSAVNAAIDKLIEVIKAIVGVVLAAGQKALSVAGDFFGLMLTLLRYAPYVALAGGGYYIYKRVKDR
jgi:hypothetical protein